VVCVGGVGVRVMPPLSGTASRQRQRARARSVQKACKRNMLGRMVPFQERQDKESIQGECYRQRCGNTGQRNVVWLQSVRKELLCGATKITQVRDACAVYSKKREREV